jgi:hypothetical protein
VEPLHIRIMLQELMFTINLKLIQQAMCTTFNVVDFGLYQIRVVDANGSYENDVVASN